MTLIAQLSDPHIRENGALAYGRVDTTGFMQMAIDQLNALSPRPDLVVITGDLVDFGTADEYDAFRRLIARLETDWVALPGNHDGPLFWEIIAGLGRPASGEADCRVIHLDEASVLLLDTSVEGQAHGTITAQSAKALEGALAATAGRPSMIFMHHPPFRTGIEHMDVIGCHGVDLLEEVLARHQHWLGIGCGHVHRMITTQLAGRPVTIAPSPAHAVSLDLNPDAPSTFHLEPPGILLHRITGAGASPKLTTYLSHIGTYEGPFPFFDKENNLLT